MKKILLMILVLAIVGAGCSKSSPEKSNENIEEQSPEDIVTEENTETVGEVEEEFDIAVGKESPDFTLKNLDGEEVSLSDYRGKIVLINFWATWCTWCDKEMPDLQKLDDENDDLVVLAVNVMEKQDVVKEYIDNGKYDFEVVLDEDGEITKTYLVSGFPTSYFVDEEGILLGGVPGAMTYEQMTSVLESIREEE
ncbi:TlpA family protein disulfide reductase [Tissierella carlieri]|uniref:TlpA family protein disulfide reductase n=1 Tax=Tissierella carlieri TaxID=689904 RepID=A0ABT1S9Y8_9FIRM|nr:TlpA disulfide reductase family protein [Tissierella carlieri]MBU5311440.1 TlpA family protein disulfide reductase [Tissierella carlieri]MCQ4923288.1 TlpA family protein disulfide reductase [Tissierella carlieri]MDU5080685.1 TlpA disulfide reductase family protein [Bacillota bacterium]